MTETIKKPTNSVCANCGDEIDDLQRDATVYRYNGDKTVVCVDCFGERSLDVDLPEGDFRMVLARHSEKRVTHALTLGILIGIALVTTSYVLLGQPADVFPLF
jgi:hypothetical protein